MAWSTIRRATDDDIAQLNAAATRFARRHDLYVGPGESPISAVDFALEPGFGASDTEQDEAARLGRLWLRVVRRTLGSRSAEGIAYGHVGYHVS